MLFFLFAYQFGKFLFTYLQAYWCLVMSHLLVKLSKAFFLSVMVFLISGIPFWFFLRVSIALLTLPTRSYVLSNFFVITLNVLTIIILDSLCGNSKVCAISESNSDACFMSSDCFFSCLLGCLAIFCCKPVMIYRAIGTEVNGLLVWGFMSI